MFFAFCSIVILGDYMNKEHNQLIDCTVHDCMYCNCFCNKCKLSGVKICNCRGEGEKETTMCSSYTKREN